MTPILKLLASAGSRAAPERDLDAAAADVDDHAVALAAEVDAVGGGDVDQPRLLGAGDDAHVDAGPLADRGEEVAAVLGLARGAGRGGDDLVDLVRVGEPAELRQRLAGRRPSPPGSGPGRRGRRRRAGPSPSRGRRSRTTDRGGPGPRSCARSWCRCRSRRGAWRPSYRWRRGRRHAHALVHPRSSSCRGTGAGRRRRSQRRWRRASAAGSRRWPDTSTRRSPAEERGIHQARVATPPAARDRADGRRDADRARRQAPTSAEAADPRARTGPRAGRGLRARRRPGPAASRRPASWRCGRT